MSARDSVLGAVRAALGRDSGAASSPPPVRRRYRLVTEVPAGSAQAVELLRERLEDYRATVVRATERELVGVVAAQLTGTASVVVPHALPRRWTDRPDASGTVVVVDDPDRPLTPDRLDRFDAVVTACRVAIADTGTIVLDGAPDQGRRILSLLPDRHVCVVRQDQVVGSVPEAVRLLGSHPTRPLTWISGPSATSDIELVRVEGVHGPRDLRVVLVVPAR